jgi:serine/threonine protein kinase
MQIFTTFLLYAHFYPFYHTFVGTVYRALHIPTGAIFAIKQLHINIRPDQQAEEQSPEIAILSRLRHENITELLHFTQIDRRLGLVFEFLPLDLGRYSGLILDKYGAIPPQLLKVCDILFYSPLHFV